MNTGQEKIVHRNLLLQASILRIKVEELEPSFSDNSAPDAICSEAELKVTIAFIPLCSTGDWTASWVAETTPDDVSNSVPSESKSVV